MTIADDDGFNTDAVVTGWFLGDVAGDSSLEGKTLLSDYTTLDSTLVLKEDWTGKYLYFAKFFVDEYGNIEDSCYRAFEAGLITTKENTSVPVDNYAPLIKSVALREGTSYGPGETVYIDYTIEDQTGVETVWFKLKDSNQNTYNLYDTNNDGNVKIELGEDIPSGIFEVDKIFVRDTTAIENSAWYFRDGTANDDAVSATHSLELQNLISSLRMKMI